MTKTRFMKALAAAAAAALLAGGALSAAQAEEIVPKDAEQCLACHGGSYEALRAQTKDWTDEFGDKVQPHQYLDSESANPHQGRQIVPNCLDCHEKHAIPLANGQKPKQATFSTCYGCHHMENFQNCSSAGCHEK